MAEVAAARVVVHAHGDAVRAGAQRQPVVDRAAPSFQPRGFAIWRSAGLAVDVQLDDDGRRSRGPSSGARMLGGSSSLGGVRPAFGDRLAGVAEAQRDQRLVFARWRYGGQCENTPMTARTGRTGQPWPIQAAVARRSCAHPWAARSRGAAPAGVRNWVKAVCRAASSPASPRRWRRARAAPGGRCGSRSPAKALGAPALAERNSSQLRGTGDEHRRHRRAARIRQRKAAACRCIRLKRDVGRGQRLSTCARARSRNDRSGCSARDAKPPAAAGGAARRSVRWACRCR